MAASLSTNYLDSVQMNVNNLGYYLDGWADLVVDKGDQADQVRKTVVELLEDRRMPQVSVIGANPSIKNETRKYNAATTYPGAATTVYVGEHGKDLYVSWRTFIKPILDRRLVASILGASGLMAVIAWGSTDSFIWSLMMFLFLAVLTTSFVAFVGRLLKGNSSAYFFVEPNLFDAEDITAMSLSVHKMLLRALDKEGIDTSQLRLKQSFKGGRRDEDI